MNLQLIWRVNVWRNGQWKPLGQFRGETSAEAKWKARRAIGNKKERLQIGSCTLDTDNDKKWNN